MLSGRGAEKGDRTDDKESVSYIYAQLSDVE